MTALADTAAFDAADYYDCCDSEQLCCETVADAIAETLECWQERGADTSAIIREHSPITVCAFRRREISPKLIRSAAEGAAEQVDEWISDEHADPEGDTLFHGEPLARLTDALTVLLTEHVARLKVWACERCGERSYGAEEIEAMMRETRPDWWPGTEGTP